MQQHRSLPQRSAYISDERWRELRIAAGIRSAAEDADIGVAELIRRGVQRELNAVNGNETYDLPEGYDG